jgi:hypothetical protein
MASKSSGKRQYTHVINVLDKLMRFSNAGWVDGKVVEIKEKRTGRQKVLVSTYVLKFDDMPSTRLERDYEATAELVDFTYQRKHGKEAITAANWSLLGIVGVNLLTKWTLELNQVAGGATPPQWLVAVDPVFIRKCCVTKFHTALQQFELLYTCGYSRFVGLPAMIELLNTHHIYLKSDNSKIRLAVQNAEKEWNAKHHPEELATVEKGVALDTSTTVALDTRCSTKEGADAKEESSPASTTEVTPEMMALFLTHIHALTQNQQSVKPERDVKRKLTDRKPRNPKKQRTTVSRSSDNNDEEWFTGTTSENSHRRLNWQKGRQDWSRPSKIKAEIDKVTVDTLPEIYPNLRKHGWAILRDCTSALSPKARFTREQMDHLLQCMSYLLYILILGFVHHIQLYLLLISS